MRPGDATADPQTSLDPLFETVLVIGSAGTAGMAVVEFVKAICRWRMRFHRYGIDRWLCGTSLSPEFRSRRDRFTSFLSEEAGIWLGRSSLPSDRAEIKRELLALVAGGDRDAEAWYDQPSEQLFAGMSRAAQLALDFPDRYPKLYEFLTEAIPVEDDQADARRWRELAPRLGRPGSALGDARDEPAGGSSGGDDPVAVRTRLGNLVAARVGTVKRWSEWRSARSNQFAAFGLAAVLFLVLEAPTMGCTPKTLGLAVVAGMMAPFAKDLSARFAGLKARR